MGNVLTISISVDVPKCFLNKKHYQINIILLSYVKQYHVFGLSNVTRILRISVTDYPRPIAIVEGTSSHVASRWARNFEFFHLLNNKSTTLPSNQIRQ